jgi:hypothetical protein
VTRRRTARILFVVGFVVLLIDGAAAIWLGQLSARRVLVGVGLLLVAAAAGLVFAYRKWMVALDAVDEARRDLHAEIERLRHTVQGLGSGARDQDAPWRTTHDRPLPDP